MKNSDCRTGHSLASYFAELARQRGVRLPQEENPTSRPTRPYVIAHRGASGYFPEHTLAAYGVAILLGADFVEPDLVMTRDGQLVARHDNLLDLTTDVATRPAFATRRTRKSIDGQTIEGWFSEDFTLAELKTLVARERIPDLRPANAQFDGIFEVPTLQEIIDLVALMEHATGRRIGIYPETKHPSHFSSLGLPMERPLVDILQRNGYRSADAPVFIQSFEISNLRLLHTLTALPLIQLLGDPGEQPYDAVLTNEALTYGDMAAPEGMWAIAQYAAGIGPDKGYLLHRDANGDLPCSVESLFMTHARAAGLQVHPYTFRAENAFLPGNLRSSDNPAATGHAADEIAQFLALGIDGFFTDQPEIGVAARRKMAEAKGD